MEEYEKIIEIYDKQGNATRKGQTSSLQKKALNTFGIKSRNKISSLFNKENVYGNKS